MPIDKQPTTIIRAGSACPVPRSGLPYHIDAVLFDFDGTLTKPGLLDFPGIRQAIGCPAEEPVLEFISGISDEVERRRSWAVMEQFEAEAADRSELNEGAAELVSFLRTHGVKLGIITRNGLDSIERTFARVSGISLGDFELVVTRDLPLRFKPAPDGLLHAASEWALDPRRLLIVGDHELDIQTGRAAGALTAFLSNGTLGSPGAAEADFSVALLSELVDVVRCGLPLPPGKLPADLLGTAREGIVPVDRSVLVGAAVGEDAAAVDVGEAEVMVLTSDPITLATDSLARYALLVNANDVATCGATPRWFLATLLFPPGSTASEIFTVVRELNEGCKPWGISVCGGHTEITDAVSRPLVVGMMAGTAQRSQLIDKKRMREGDVILLTKRVAVEGTGLLAREYGARLAAAGMSPDEIETCKAFLDNVSILDEARIARDFTGVTAMHDVTEGGVATALVELSTAGGHRLRIQLDSIPIYPETEKVCAALGLDPLGLLGSGTMLLSCAPGQAEALQTAVRAAGIEITEIGVALHGGHGIEALRGDRPAAWPVFERDEVSRLSG